MPPAGRARTRARERALHLLYEAEAKNTSPAGVLEELPVAPEPYAAELAAGVSGRAGEIDTLVAGHATGWSLGRLPSIDRQVLRLATFELLAEPDVPVAVVIDEAVELAKAYSTEDSGRYVNGVLAAIARHLGRLPASETIVDGDPAAGDPAAAAQAQRRPPGAIGSVRAARRR